MGKGGTKTWFKLTGEERGNSRGASGTWNVPRVSLKVTSWEGATCLTFGKHERRNDKKMGR